MVNGTRHKHIKFSLNNPSLSQSALGSQGSDEHGSGTVINFIGVYACMQEICSYERARDNYTIEIPEQLNPSPSVNGDWQVQEKPSVSNPSLSQMALTSQGSLRQGSGTTKECNLDDSEPGLL